MNLPNSLDAQRGEMKSRVKRAENKIFPIVGIGASAGGLEAFEQFLRNMPPDSGMAFVLVPHLDPTYKDIMAELKQLGISLRENEERLKGLLSREDPEVRT